MTTRNSNYSLSEHTLHTQSCQNINFIHKAVRTYTSSTKLSENTLHPHSCRNIHFTYKTVETYTSSTNLLEHTFHPQNCRNRHFTHKAVGTYTSPTKLSEHTLISKHTDSSANIWVFRLAILHLLNYLFTMSGAKRHLHCLGENLQGK